MMFDHLKLRSRIMFAYAIPVMLFMVATALVYDYVKSSENASNQVENAHAIVNLVMETELAASQMLRSERGYLLLMKDEYIDLFGKGDEDLTQALVALRNEVKDQKQLESLNEIGAIKIKLVLFMQHLVDLTRAGQKELAMRDLESGEGQLLFSQLESLIQAFKTREHALLVERQLLEREALDSLFSTMWITALLALLFSLFIGWWLARRLTDELSLSMGVITTSSTEIAATVAQHERTVTQQNASVNETTVTIEELGASARQSAEQSQSASAAAKEAQELTCKGVE
ncbi:MAG: CHASE3 domain-containing protein, partial [Zetaproteobacteria bacterium]|nr:CHASE3 domain-containing protein [Zetaproteobacteria bacterium]